MVAEFKRCVTTIVLTFNSEQSLARVLESCSRVSEKIVVVDSFSTDRTKDIATSFGVEFVQHAFEDYSSQRNWAQEYANAPHGTWILHLDDDEVLSPELEASIIRELSSESIESSGFLVRKLFFFLGVPIRYGCINPSWHLRLFRHGSGVCETRLYDQHFVLTTGSARKIEGLLHDLQLVSLERWTAAHNRWSDLEAKEAIVSGPSVQMGEAIILPAALNRDNRMRKRWYKNNVYYRAPPLLRAFLFFTYSYVFRLGFLDGKVGLIYHVLQSFWFRFLVDAKIIEQRMEEQRKH